MDLEATSQFNEQTGTMLYDVIKKKIEQFYQKYVQ